MKVPASPHTSWTDECAEQFAQIGRQTLQIGASLRQAGRPALALLILISLFAAGSHVRNRVWLDPGDLWQDIAEKTYRQRIIDPATGRESPRTERGRIYNNIGLYLYDQARSLIVARRTLKQVENLLLLDDQNHPANPALAAQLKELRASRQDLRRQIAADEERLSGHIPAEFRAASAAAGPRLDRHEGDEFLPARLCLVKALYHSPKYYIARLNLGLVYKLTGNLEKAEEQFRLAHVFFPAYQKALRYHAKLLGQLGEHAEALRIAERALDCYQPSDGEDAWLDTLTVAAQSALCVGQAAQAERYLTEAVSRAGPLLLRRREYAEEYLQLYFDLARARQFQGNFNGALQALRTALPGAGAQEPALRRLVVGVLLAAGRYDDAAREARLAAAAFPNSILGGVLSVRCQLAAGKLAAADEQIARLRQEWPKNWEPLFLEGLAAQKRGDPAKALAACEKTAGLYGGAAEVWHELAKLRRLAGHPEAAREAALRAVELDPADPDFRRTREELEGKK